MEYASAVKNEILSSAAECGVAGGHSDGDIRQIQAHATCSLLLEQPVTLNRQTVDLSSVSSSVT